MREKRSLFVRDALPFFPFPSPVGRVDESDSSRDIDALAVVTALPASSFRRFLVAVRSVLFPGGGADELCRVVSALDFLTAPVGSPSDNESETELVSELEVLGTCALLITFSSFPSTFISSSLLFSESELSELEPFFFALSIFVFSPASTPLSLESSLPLSLAAFTLTNFVASLTFAFGFAVSADEESELELLSVLFESSPVVNVLLDDLTEDDVSFFLRGAFDGATLAFLLLLSDSDPESELSESSELELSESDSSLEDAEASVVAGGGLPFLLLFNSTSAVDLLGSESEELESFELELGDVVDDAEFLTTFLTVEAAFFLGGDLVELDSSELASEDDAAA